jgi:hypothetical protein
MDHEATVELIETSITSLDDELTNFRRQLVSSQDDAKTLCQQLGTSEVALTNVRHRLVIVHREISLLQAVNSELQQTPFHSDPSIPTRSILAHLKPVVWDQNRRERANKDHVGPLTPIWLDPQLRADI